MRIQVPEAPAWASRRLLIRIAVRQPRTHAPQAVAAVLLWSLPKIYGYVTFKGIERTAFLHIPFSVLFSIYIPFVVSVVIRNLRTAWWAVLDTGYDRPPHESVEAEHHA